MEQSGGLPIRAIFEHIGGVELAGDRRNTRDIYFRPNPANPNIYPVRLEISPERRLRGGDNSGVTIAENERGRGIVTDIPVNSLTLGRCAAQK